MWIRGAGIETIPRHCLPLYSIQKTRKTLVYLVWVLNGKRTYSIIPGYNFADKARQSLTRHAGDVDLDQRYLELNASPFFLINTTIITS